MKFLKNNSYDIVKLFINQIGITIFSLVLYSAIGFMEDEALETQLRIWLSVFATCFYLVLIYCTCWDYGARDKIRVDGGKQDRFRSKGALMSLIANIPNFVLALLAVIFMGVYMSAGSEGAYSSFALVNLIMRFLNAMFLGLLQGIFSFLEDSTDLYYFWQSAGYFLAPVITVLAAHLGYTLGFKEKRLLGFLSVNNNSGKNNK